MGEIHERFRATWHTKTEAKHVALAAMGEAYLAEKEGRESDADQAWASHMANGMSEGIEGQKFAEAVAVAEEWADAYPERVAFIRTLAEGQVQLDPDAKTVQQACAPLASAARLTGNHELLAEIEMFHLAHFEVQNLTGNIKAVARRPMPGGGA